MIFRRGLGYFTLVQHSESDIRIGTLGRQPGASGNRRADRLLSTRYFTHAGFAAIPCRTARFAKLFRGFLIKAFRSNIGRLR
jgi:hypothetical protein